jgi:predicted hydrocarbon binding protein
MNLFEKFALSRHVLFSDGDIQLFGNRVVLIQSGFFSEYGKSINDSPEKVLEFYNAAKISFREEIAKSIGTEFSFNFQNFFNWMTDIAILAGWGILKWSGLDEKNMTGGITVENSPVAKNLAGKAILPVDHLIRGFIAGGASAAFKSDIDAIETDCVVLGAPICKFVFKPNGKTTK